MSVEAGENLENGVDGNITLCVLIRFQKFKMRKILLNFLRQESVLHIYFFRF